MKRVKYLISILIGLSFCLSSCNKNDSTPHFIHLPVIETFEPVMKEFVIPESQDIIPYKEETFVVNSISELPDDVVFGNDEFLNQDIDFSKYSLIIFYDIQFGKIASVKYKWGYDSDLELYSVAISYEIEKGSDIIDGEVELVNYVRGAMLVDHIPQQTFVSQWVGVHFIDLKNF